MPDSTTPQARRPRLSPRLCAHLLLHLWLLVGWITGARSVVFYTVVRSPHAGKKNPPPAGEPTPLPLATLRRLFSKCSVHDRSDRGRGIRACRGSRVGLGRNAAIFPHLLESRSPRDRLSLSL